MSVYDTQSDENRDESLQAALDAVREGKLIVLPTDTVYGIGADAFDPAAVQSLRDAKGRGRSVPPPVLVGDPSVLLALAVDVPDYAETLAETFWPGALTLILRAQPTLSWDLGETRGTVALRMPDDPVALDLLRRTGPLAVSSANRHGKPAATTVVDAASQLGDTVEVYLDGGKARLGTSSTIVDTTVEPAEILRAGAITREQIIAAVGDIFTEPEPEPEDDAVDSGEETPEEVAAEAGDLENPEDPAAPADLDAVDPEAPADAPELDPEAAADAPAADPEAPSDAPATESPVPAAPVEVPAGESPAVDTTTSDPEDPESTEAAHLAERPASVPEAAGVSDATDASAPMPSVAATGPLALPSESDAAPSTEGRIG